MELNRERIILASNSSPEYSMVVVNYGYFDRNGFNPFIPSETFYRLIQNFETSNIKPVITRKKCEIRGSINHCAPDWFVQDPNLYEDNNRDYGYQVAVEQRRTINPLTEFKANQSKEIETYSYSLVGGVIKLELMRVKTPKLLYQARLIPVNATPSHLSDLEKVGGLILRLILDTNILYTQSMKESLVVYYNTLLGLSKDRYKLSASFSQSRELKRQDLVWGGIVGNDKTGYGVSHTPSGERKLLIYAPNGIWLITPPYKCNLITTQIYQGLEGTILDCVDVPLNSRRSHGPKDKHWLLVSDILSYQGDIGVQTKPLTDRLILAQQTINQGQLSIPINTLTLRTFNTADKFFSVMRETLRESTVLAYLPEGLTFKPITASYIPMVRTNEGIIPVSVLPSWKRTLPFNIDVVVWKSTPTITFQVGQDRGGVNLYLDSPEGSFIFEGTFQYPITQPFNLPSLKNYSVVKFKWEGELIPVQEFASKSEMLSLDEARVRWNYIHEPITAETLEGKNTELLDYYKQRTRDSLLSAVKTEMDSILDLTGEYRYPWKGYQHIYLYSPGLKPPSRSVHVINSLEEVKSKVDVIYFNNSLSFNQVITAIKTKLKPDGAVIFSVMDGYAATQLFYPTFTHTNLEVNKIESGKLTLSYTRDNNTLTIISGEKKDTLEPIFIYDLIEAIPTLNINSIYRYDTEELMPAKDKILARIQSFGIITPFQSASSEKKPTLAERRNVSQTSLDRGGSGRINIPSAVQLRPNKVSLPPTGPFSVNPTVRSVPRPRPQKIRDKLLSSLHVSAPKISSKPGIGDDKLQKIKVTWTPEEVYRIACIGDGSCFFHAYLKAFYPPYQDNNSYSSRTGIVRSFRDELGSLITEIDPSTDFLRYYNTAAGGAWVELWKEQKTDETGLELDYSIEGMVNLFLSDEDVGDEVYNFVSEIIGIDVYVMIGKTSDLYHHINTSTDDTNRKCVVIVGNEHHYELVSVMRDGALQTVFYSDDPFIIALNTSKLAVRSR